MRDKIIKGIVDKNNPRVELRTAIYDDGYIVATDLRILILFKEEAELPKTEKIWYPSKKGLEIATEDNYLSKTKEYQAYQNGMLFTCKGVYPEWRRVIAQFVINNEATPLEYDAVIVKNLEQFYFALAQRGYIIDFRIAKKLIFKELIVYIKDTNGKHGVYPIFFKNEEHRYIGAMMPRVYDEDTYDMLKKQVRSEL